MEIPLIGLGTFAIKDPQNAINSIRYAIEDVGYRHLDTACVYGNEEVIGEALSQIFQAGKVKRSELFITTKLWSTYRRPERVQQALNESLSKLKLDYVDLYLIHSPAAFVYSPDTLFPKDENQKYIWDHVDILDTYKAMETLVHNKQNDL